MLDENDVIDAVCDYLKSTGYAIAQQLSTTAQGIDIIAKHPNHHGRLLIEAKGATSARAGSARYGLGFNENQVFDRVGKGFYTAACMYTENRGNGDHVGLAFPNTPLFRKYLHRIKAVTNALEITVYLVDDTPQRTVTVSYLE